MKKVDWYFFGQYVLLTNSSTTPPPPQTPGDGGVILSLFRGLEWEDLRKQYTGILLTLYYLKDTDEIIQILKVGGYWSDV